MEPEEIGKFITKLRKEKKLTQKELGKILNISDKTISKWERGTYTPDITMVKKLSQVLEVSVYDLLNGKKSNKRVEDDGMIKNISLYIRQTKNKYIKYIIMIIIILLTSFYTIEKTIEKHEWHMDEFESKNTELFNIEGIIAYNKEESLYLFTGMEYVGNDVGTTDEPLVTKIEATLYLDDKMLCKKINQPDTPTEIHLATRNMTLFLKKSKIVYNSSKKVSIHIEYKDEENNTYNTILRLN